MAEPSPRKQKLTWFKSLAGADLTNAEFRILVLLANYSGANLEEARPSVATLVKDSGLSESHVHNVLKSLLAKKAVTQEGGNKVFKGAVNVYKILTPPQRPKGATQSTLQGDNKGAADCTLQDDSNDTPGGDKSGSKGPKISSKGPTTRQTRVQPSGPHQVNTPGPLDHSARKLAAPVAPQAGASGRGQHDENAHDHIDLQAIEDDLDEQLGLTDEERRTADGMLQRGAHPTAVRNKINRDRQPLGIFNDANQDQKRLDEEPRCKNCGVTMSRHAQWLADSGDIHVFATTVT
jgi:hypothetical protein